MEEKSQQERFQSSPYPWLCSRAWSSSLSRRRLWPVGRNTFGDRDALCACPLVQGNVGTRLTPATADPLPPRAIASLPLAYRPARPEIHPTSLTRVTVCAWRLAGSWVLPVNGVCPRSNSASGGECARWRLGIKVSRGSLPIHGEGVV